MNLAAYETMLENAFKKINEDIHKDLDQLEDDIMEPGDKYLRGNLDLGALGKQRITVLPNENKEKEKQPDHYVYIEDGEDLKRVGALWINKKKQSEDVEPEEQSVY